MVNNCPSHYANQLLANQPLPGIAAMPAMAVHIGKGPEKFPLPLPGFEEIYKAGQARGGVGSASSKELSKGLQLPRLPLGGEDVKTSLVPHQLLQAASTKTEKDKLAAAVPALMALLNPVMRTKNMC
jgi:hypothetical protein